MFQKPKHFRVSCIIMRGRRLQLKKTNKPSSVKITFKNPNSTSAVANELVKLAAELARDRYLSQRLTRAGVGGKAESC